MAPRRSTPRTKAILASRTSIIFLEIFLRNNEDTSPGFPSGKRPRSVKSWNSFDSPKENDDSSSVARVLCSAVALNHRSYHGPYSFRIMHVGRIESTLCNVTGPYTHYRDSLSSRSPSHSIPFDKDFVGTRSISALPDVNARHYLRKFYSFFSKHRLIR